MTWEWNLIIKECTGCGICADVCPSNAIALTSDMAYPGPVPSQCEGCLKCVHECPFDAIHVQQTEVTVG